MSLERVRLLVERFRDGVLGAGTRLRAPNPWTLEADLGLELLESMLLARHLDRAAHELRASGHGHYTICSSGHEGNVVLGRVSRPEDPSLLHYRSAALYVERARAVPTLDPVRDITLSLVASTEEPASGGRHKVFGNRALGIIPQTSTIASHLPRAVGLGLALERRARLDPSAPRDAIVIASFGDASLNHSTALGALNAASLAVHQNLKVPLLFVCEDNGLGISVRTPPGWVRARASALPYVRVFSASAWDLDETYRAAADAVAHCRTSRLPAFLHLTCVRLLGHAGSDVDTSYRSAAELEEVLERDPVPCHAEALLAAGCATPAQLLELDAGARARVDREAERARSRPRFETRAEIAGALVRPLPPSALSEAHSLTSEPVTLAQAINRSLGHVLETHPDALIFGEDVAKKGGVYGLTKGLFERFGPARVFNTLLDEQMILGLALGAATLGQLPIAEIQYLAYLHNAEDQLRGEASTFRFFSNGAYENPMILRIAGLAYQKGFGGHFHNDNSLAVLRDIPGIALAVPARADDAFAIYRSAVELVRRAGRVVVIVEPIALYHQKDLVDGDGAWLATDTGETAELGRARVYRPEARDLTLLSYANGLRLSLAAAERLSLVHGIQARVLDLRWICPLPESDVLHHAQATGRVLIVDECRRSGNVGEALSALLAERAADVRVTRVASEDCFIPLGEAATLVLVSEEEIVDAARHLVGIH